MQGLVRVRGRVQGVGFRPFVYRLARELDLSGWVRNDPKGVEIAISGKDDAVSDFLNRLESESPVLSKVEKIEFSLSQEREREGGFTIRESLEGRADTGIPPDVSVCPECVSELFDPSNRRYRHPFINCTHCGPRFTLLSNLPYDRKHTSMGHFQMCPECHAEYLDPADRRFHAQPNACGNCGPVLTFHDVNGQPISGDGIANALDAILSGKIVAVKGVGGFHLFCDAKNRASIERLRNSKARMEKPLALMAANVPSLLPYAHVGDNEKALLESRERPVLLLKKRRELVGIAPGVIHVGAMLPYSPIHYLLFHEAAGRPDGISWLECAQDLILVATSANPRGEPIVIENDDALNRLDADLFLVHDREILSRCDDSVMRWTGSSAQFVRRARGYAPSAVSMPISGPSVLATGSGYKNTICLTRRNEAFVSQHIGDLDNAAACMAMEEAVDRLMKLLNAEPEIVAHDLHPDIYCTKFAQGFSERLGIPCMGIQHHHAHVASVMAEHGLTGPVTGLALDGTGLGNDGAAWGGELLHVDEKGGFLRLGHLAEMLLPGGDAASREPWRIAAGFLHSRGRMEELEMRYGRMGAALNQMIERRFNTPVASSMGRLFDAAAALLGIMEKTTFEGQAAMLLEKMAEGYGQVKPMENACILENGVLDFSPLLDEISLVRGKEYGAALFHCSLVEGLKYWVLAENAEKIVFSGGCFMNSLLSTGLRKSLEKEGVAVFEALCLPPNDGGISLGQCYAAMLGKMSCA